VGSFGNNGAPIFKQFDKKLDLQQHFAAK